MLGVADGERSVRVHMFDWITAGDFTVRAGLLVDPLSITFALLITVVGTLIHLYSVGYMAQDPDRRDRKSTRLNSSHVAISYAVFCLKKKNTAVDADTNFFACFVHFESYLVP